MSIKIYITNLGKFNEGYGCQYGTWVQLPIKNDKLQDVLKEIGISEEYEEFFITDYETSLSGMKYVITEFSNIVALNELAELIDELSEEDNNKLNAVLECDYCSSIEDVKKIISELDNFELLPEIIDNEELGYYFAEEVGYLNIPEEVKSYFNYEKYGRDMRIESSGVFTSLGFLIDYR
jgi:antirestriction protein